MSDAIDPDLICQFNAALSNLPSRQREIFRAHRLDAKSYAEIARSTGLTANQVEQHFARALAKLMKQMDGHKLTLWERWF